MAWGYDSFGFFVFKQKTAYEMRISDWSSDVCSSDLGPRRRHRGLWSAGAGRGDGGERGRRGGRLGVRWLRGRCRGGGSHGGAGRGAATDRNLRLQDRKSVV